MHLKNSIPRATLIGLGLALGSALAPVHTAQAALQAPALLPSFEGALSSWQDADEEPGYLGISYAIAEGGGVQVTEVRKDTPAERAGLQGGDVIISAGDRKVKSDDALLDVLAKRGPGSKLVLGVRRGEETLKVKVTLASRANPAGSTDDEKQKDKQKDKQKEEAKKKQKDEEQKQSDKRKSERDAAGVGSSGEADEIRETLRALGYVQDDATAQSGSKEDAKQRAQAEARAAQDEAAAALEALRGLGTSDDATDAAQDQADEAGHESGFLGVFPSDAKDGVRIDSLVDGAAAATGGIRAGDLLRSIDGVPVKNSEELREQLSSRAAGTAVALELLREGNVLSLVVALGARPNDAAPPEGIEAIEEVEEEPILRDVEVSDAWVERNEELRESIERELRGLEQEAQSGRTDRREGERRTDRPAARSDSEADAIRRELQALRSQPGAQESERNSARAAAQRGFLGVMLDGLTVTDTVDQSAAQRAGIRAGETIRSLDGEAVESLEDLQRLLGQRPPGTRTVVALTSERGAREVSVVLGRSGEQRAPAEVETGISVAPPAIAPDVLESLGGLPTESRGYLGVALEEEDGQVTVTEVLEGTPAARAGVQAGDRISKIAGKSIHTVEDLRAAFAGLDVGEEFKLVVDRNGDKARLSAALAPRPDVARSGPEGSDAEREHEARQHEAEAREREAEARAHEAEARKREAEARQRERSERRGSDSERLFQRFEQRRERELKQLEEQLTRRSRELQRDLEAREKALEKELEALRKQLEGDEGGRARAERMQERLRRWREGNDRAIKDQQRALRERVRALREGEGDGQESSQLWLERNASHGEEGGGLLSLQQHEFGDAAIVLRNGEFGDNVVIDVPAPDNEDADERVVRRFLVRGSAGDEVPVELHGAGVEGVRVFTDGAHTFDFRGMEDTAPAPEAPLPPAVDGVRETLRALRAEVEALRSEVKALRSQVRGR